MNSLKDYLVAYENASKSERLELAITIRYIIANFLPGDQIKRVVDYLLEKRQALTPREIVQGCHVSIHNRSIFDGLKNHPRVSYDGIQFSYKPKYDVSDKKELLYLIRKSPNGIAFVDLKDSYPTVLEDLEALKDSGQILLPINCLKDSLNWPQNQCYVRFRDDPDSSCDVDG